MSEIQTLTPGTVFARDYRVVRPLSEGGMGAVYLVEQLSTGSQRALKLMHPHLLHDPKLRQRFEQEARIAGRIESDHVVQVVASGVDEATRLPYLAMELLKGEDLSDLLDRRGALAPAEVDEIFGQMCHALGAAHSAGIVHRDLKPENVFIAAPRSEGARVMVKLLDFGIARIAEEARTALTGAIGTPLWMAPEQTSASRAITTATDIWPLGLMAFRMLTGKAFWLAANGRGDTMTLLREIVVDPVPAASERAAEIGVAQLLPPGFDAWFARCVAREPAARFAHASEARAGLAQVLGAPHVVITPPDTAYANPRQTEPAAPIAGAMVAAYPSAGALQQHTGSPVAAYTSPGAPPPHTGSPVAAYPSPAAPLPQHTGAQGAYTSPGAPPFASAPVLGAAPPPGWTPPVAKPKRGSNGAVIAAVSVIGVMVIGGGIFGLSFMRRSAVMVGCDATDHGATARLQSCKEACDAGAARGCAVLGDLSMMKGSGRSIEDAASAYERACDGGAPRGCRKLGALVERGAVKRAQAADALYNRACDGGDLGGCVSLGAALELGRGVGPDATRAVSLYQRACDGDAPIGCVHLGAAIAAGRGAPADMPRAKELFTRAVDPLRHACDGGDAAACAALGFLLDAGFTPGGEKEAVAIYQRACDGGEPLGCNGLGARMAARQDRGGPAILDEACKAGEPAACHNLAVTRAGGEVALLYGARAASIYVECDRATGLGCEGEGRVHFSAGQDAASAIDLEARACEAGLAAACDVLARRELAVARDRARARAFFQRACERGDAPGCAGLEALKSPFMAGQDWKGRYQCAQGPTSVTIHVGAVNGARVEGVFDFLHGASGNAGRFRISGDYVSSTGFIHFEPGEWIARPRGYIAVGFEGTVSGAHFAGKILHPSCGAIEFDLAGKGK